MNTKKYALINRRTGKVNRKASTRAEAREIKKASGFKFSIMNLMTGMIVR